ncbi:MAG: DUF3135 domain-containing protein [Sulfuricella sp.]|nr:DUF3135 domain-containing protein [Sulfuricella sp.]
MAEKNIHSINSFDFDAWVKLARSDPAAFDRRRQEYLEGIIEKSRGDKARLRGMQWRIDMERRKDGTPLKTCLWISEMMWDSFHDLDTELHRIGQDHSAPAERANPPGAAGNSARVFSFAIRPAPPPGGNARD